MKKKETIAMTNDDSIIFDSYAQTEEQVRAIRNGNFSIKITEEPLGKSLSRIKIALIFSKNKRKKVMLKKIGKALLFLLIPIFVITFSSILFITISAIRLKISSNNFKEFMDFIHDFRESIAIGFFTMAITFGISIIPIETVVSAYVVKTIIYSVISVIGFSLGALGNIILSSS